MMHAECPLVHNKIIQLRGPGSCLQAKLVSEMDQRSHLIQDVCSEGINMHTSIDWAFGHVLDMSWQLSQASGSITQFCPVTQAS